MEKTVSLRKYLLTCALGFGLGGLLWGVVLYSELPDLEYPFHFMAILIMGLFGGISLTLFSKSVKKISKAVLIGFLGWGVGILLGAMLLYPLFLAGAFLLSVIPLSLLEAEFITLKPNIDVSGFWLVFLLIGAIVGLFYALFLKLKKWSIIWRAGLGLAIGSLIGPIIGNLLGNLFNCILLSYLVTLSLLSAIFGVFLAWGVYCFKKG